MKRSLITTASALAFLSLLATGCGQQATSGVPYSQLAHTATKTSSVAPKTTGLVGNNAAAAQTGRVVLQMSSLRAAYEVMATRQDVASLEVRMSGPGLDAPLVKGISAADLQTSNTVTFDNVPATKLSVQLTAFDSNAKSIGQKTTQVMVQADQQTTVNLQLKLNPTVVQGQGSLAFDFDIVDGDVVNAPPSAAPSADPSTSPSDDASTTPSASPSAGTSDDGTLGIEIVDKEVERKYFLFKKLVVTVKVTNHNTTQSLNGEVKLDYYHTSGIIHKTTAVSETMTQEVQDLAPGKSVTLTFTSTKAAEDAEATVHTVLASATASTEE
jgi:hypothetical protein